MVTTDNANGTDTARAYDLRQVFRPEEREELETVTRETLARLEKGTLYERTVRWYAVNRLYQLLQISNR